MVRQQNEIDGNIILWNSKNISLLLTKKIKHSHRQKNGSYFFSFFIEEEQNWGEKYWKLKYKKLRQHKNK